MGELLVSGRVIFEYLLQEHLIHTLYLCVYIYTRILEDKDIYLSISLLKHCILPKNKHTKIWEISDYLTVKETYIIYLLVFCIIINMLTSKILKVMGISLPQKIPKPKIPKPKKLTTAGPCTTHKGHLGCGTDRSWYVASAFRLAWTWFGVRGEGVTLSGWNSTHPNWSTPRPLNATFTNRLGKGIPFIVG